MAAVRTGSMKFTQQFWQTWQFSAIATKAHRRLTARITQWCQSSGGSNEWGRDHKANWKHLRISQAYQLQPCSIRHWWRTRVQYLFGEFSLVYSQSLALGCSSARDNGTALQSWSDRDVAVRQPPTWAGEDRDAKQSAERGAGAEGGIAALYLFA